MVGLLFHTFLIFRTDFIVSSNRERVFNQRLPAEADSLRDRGVCLRASAPLYLPPDGKNALDKER
jgi:hypothetical protein